MDGICRSFVHALLFRCTRCQEFLPVFIAMPERNLENIDGTTFNLDCKCGWIKKLRGMQAVRHWVIPCTNPDDAQETASRWGTRRT
jgi:hypothetical protein